MLKRSARQEESFGSLGVLKKKLSFLSDFLKLNCFNVFFPRFLLFIKLFFTINVCERNDIKRKLSYGKGLH